MPTTWYEGLVVDIQQAGPQTRRFWLEIKDVEKFDFQAGQFITMDLPIHEKRLHRWRSYSIASGPSGANRIELCIVRLEGGLATQYLFEEVGIGSVIRFKGPDGTFTLPESRLPEDLVFICTGTGIAPFRSMLQDIDQRGLPFRNIHLIFGTRTADSILYRDEMEKYREQWPSFRYDIALSREKEWPGYKGYVHQIYLEHYPKPRPDVHFFICGWKNMIDDAVANLLLKTGFDRSQIHYELYG